MKVYALTTHLNNDFCSKIDVMLAVDGVHATLEGAKASAVTLFQHYFPDTEFTFIEWNRNHERGAGGVIWSADMYEQFDELCYFYIKEFELGA